MELPQGRGSLNIVSGARLIGAKTLTDGGRGEAAIASDLVARIACGDAAAEIEFYERYTRVLVFYLRRLTRDRALADDLHQDTFRIALLRLRREPLAQPELLANFLYRTAKNLAIGQQRKSARQQTYSTEDEVIERAAESNAPSALTSVLYRERASLVREMIQEIKSDRDRTLLYRYYVAEDAKESLCEELDLSHRHFDRVLFRARQRLKELVVRFEKREARSPRG